MKQDLRKMSVAVIITTKNSSRTLQACLASVRAQTWTPIELIVVDNGSTDNTVAIAHLYADRVLQGGPERSAQRNIGIKASTASYMCILDADMILENNVIEQAMNAIANGMNAVAIPERSIGEGFWSRCKIAERECYLDDGTTAAARFFSRELLDRIGLYDESLTGPEDWDLSMRATAGRRAHLINAIILHDEGRQSLWNLFRKKMYYGASMRKFIRKHGASALARLQPVRPSLVRGLGKLFKEPQVGIGCVIMKSVEFIGIAAGTLFGVQPRVETIYKPVSPSAKID